MVKDITMIKDIIQEYILNTANVDKNRIQNDSLIFKEGYFDSMGFIVLITFLEENFKISIGENDLVEENFESIDAITSYIIRKTENK
jgi:acyl carrier protein